MNTQPPTLALGCAGLLEGGGGPLPRHLPEGISREILDPAGFFPPTSEFTLQGQKAAIGPPLCRVFLS